MLEGQKWLVNSKLRRASNAENLHVADKTTRGRDGPPKENHSNFSYHAAGNFQGRRWPWKEEPYCQARKKTRKKNGRDRGKTEMKKPKREEETKLLLRKKFEKRVTTGWKRLVIGTLGYGFAEIKKDLRRKCTGLFLCNLVLKRNTECFEERSLLIEKERNILLSKYWFEEPEG